MFHIVLAILSLSLLTESRHHRRMPNNDHQHAHTYQHRHLPYQNKDHRSNYVHTSTSTLVVRVFSPATAATSRPLEEKDQSGPPVELIEEDIEILVTSPRTHARDFQADPEYMSKDEDKASRIFLLAAVLVVAVEIGIIARMMARV